MLAQNCFRAVIFIIMAFNTAYTQIILEGVVTDTGSEPVHDALVVLTDQANTSRIFRDYTNLKGRYRLQLGTTRIDEPDIENPSSFHLYPNYPNPFNPSTVIAFELTKPSRVRIDIHNILGQKVRTLFDGFQSNRKAQLIWEGTDDRGHAVPAGIYLYSLRAEGRSVHRKMLLIDGSGTIAFASSNPMIKSSYRWTVSKALFGLYRLKVSGEDIETYEHSDLIIDENMVFDVTVTRIVTDIDGNIYRTMKIGDQWWMAENLKVTQDRYGSPIPNITDDTQWSSLITSAYCNYSKDADSAAAWDYLYNGYIADNSSCVAPEGWHIPSDEEWKVLEMTLGMSQAEANASGWRGQGIGGKLKETGTTHWTSPNTGATNESGFTSLGSGMRSDQGIFEHIRETAVFWSTTEADGGNDRMARYLRYDDSSIGRMHDRKQCGFSIRCIRDAPDSDEPYSYPDIRDRSLVVQDIDQSEIYQGFDSECKVEWCIERRDQNELEESIPDTLGDSSSPLYFILAVHTCDDACLADPSRFDSGVSNIRRIQNLLSEYSGMLSFQVTMRWAELTQENNEEILSWLADQGSEIAIHIHEEYLIPGYLGLEYQGGESGRILAQQQPISVWIGAFRLLRNKVELISSVSPIRLFTGAPMCADRFFVAAKAELNVTASYKNPETRTTDERLAVLNPWRPAGSSDVAEIATYDRNGPIIFVPSGAYPAHCANPEGIPTPFTHASMDYITMLIRTSLGRVISGRINVFSIVFHPWDFEESDFILWKTWLDSVIKPLLDSHRMEWSTFGEVADMYETWEKTTVQN